MSSDLKIIAMIPARIGSTRLKMKNLALINGEPMISYAINAAKRSSVFDKIVINSDSKIFQKIADRYGVEFFQRPDHLGSSATKSDDVILDFMKNYHADIIVWVNPICPFQTGSDIKNVTKYFLSNKLDSLITVEDKDVHCLYKGKPVNYNSNELFAQTQDMIPVQTFVYSIMMWRRKTFINKYNKDGYALFCGRFGTFPASKIAGLIIKNKDDLKIADLLIRGLNKMSGDYEVGYDSLVLSTIDHEK